MEEIFIHIYPLPTMHSYIRKIILAETRWLRRWTSTKLDCTHTQWTYMIRALTIIHEVLTILANPCWEKVTRYIALYTVRHWQLHVLLLFTVIINTKSLLFSILSQWLKSQMYGGRHSVCYSEIKYIHHCKEYCVKLIFVRLHWTSNYSIFHYSIPDYWIKICI